MMTNASALTQSDIDHYEKTGEYPAGWTAWAFRFEIALLARSGLSKLSSSYVGESLPPSDNLEMVPAEPTKKMLQAGADTGCFVASDEDCREWLWREHAGTVWRAMLAASRISPSESTKEKS